MVSHGNFGDDLRVKKSSCSLIDERLGLAFGKMYSVNLIVMLVSVT